MDIPKSIRRSACDRCRAKRVRCPRAEGSTAPCARCVHVGAKCVTGSPGYPGRPRKTRLVDDNMTSADDGASPSISLPTQRDGNHVDLQTPAAEEPMLTDMGMTMGMATAWTGTHTESLNPLNGLAGLGHSEFWATPDSTNFFDFLLTNASPASDRVPTEMAERSSNSSQQQGLLSAANSLEIMHTDQDYNNILNVGSLLGSSEYLSDQSGPAEYLSATTLLMRFQEKMEQRVATMGAFFSNPRNVVEDCKANDSMDMATENPVAIVLMCTKEFIDIIHKLTTATQPDITSSDPDESTRKGSVLVQPNAMPPWISQPKSLSTQTILLVLSTYLALMKLYDSLFHGVYRCFCQISPEVIKSIKVKAVFRVAGISSLQDMPVKAYAMGIIDVIQNQIKDLECCMGLPPGYCLLSEITSPNSSTGLFANRDRARLLRTVMEQDDVESQGDENKSYVESIRQNIKNSMAYFGD